MGQPENVGQKGGPGLTGDTGVQRVNVEKMDDQGMLDRMVTED